MTVSPLDEVLGQLKDFQRLTSEHVFRRLYTDPDRTDRFLVADEVGLGKTLVARGVIAQAIDHLSDTVDRVDIVYVCSNLQIARQNVRRLTVPGVEAFEEVDRITLLPLSSRRLRSQKVNIVAITPGTSMAVKGGTGWSRERAVLRLILKKTWEPKRFQSRGSMRVFQGGVHKLASFENEYRKIERNHEKSLDPRVVKRLRALIVEYNRESGHPTLQKQFDGLCSLYGHARPKTKWSPHERWRRNQFIGQMRHLLARASLDVLEPDLIILDEFQRFKGLLAEPGNDSSDPAAELAHELFNYVDTQANTKAKVLLLSATPYKMLTRAVDDEDDHHSDLVDTASFLLDHDEESVAELRHALSSFRRSLLQAGNDHGTAAMVARHRVEAVLRRIMVRTERLASTREGSDMFVEPPRDHLSLTVDDVDRFVSMSKLATELNSPDPVEYWKSAPYLLNFMDSYVMKRTFLDRLEKGTLPPRGALRTADLLDWGKVRRYAPIEFPNARLRRLLAETVYAGTWKLLWIQPSMPYVTPSGPFSEPGIENFTKRLVFSAWTMVPTMLASLLTYEAERKMVNTGGKPAYRNTPTARSKRARLLEFGKSANRLTGMPVVSLLYPSPTLAEIGNQLEMAGSAATGPLNGTEAHRLVVGRVESLLDQVVEDMRAKNLIVRSDGAADERWYWAAPLWFDRLQDEASASAFFRQVKNGQAGWYATPDQQPESEGLIEHLRHARATMNNYPEDLGRQPDDLAEVLAAQALGGPATLALRTLARAANRSVWDETVREKACRIAWAFRALFNGPEVIAMVRSEIAGDRYWQQVLGYCFAGNLEAVLDEYIHVLIPARGHLKMENDDTIDDVAQKIHDAVHLRTVNYAVSDIRINDGVTVERGMMRANYAVRLSDERADDGNNTRVSDVRDAFNSPFWPFVLATTSAGQEGLDFHLYAHAVVHWNLPGSPVDLEQREGRVHRFMGHAVRKNVASHYRNTGLSTQDNPWESMFLEAQRERDAKLTDVVPYWVYTTVGGSAIERHSPVWPLSRDEYQADALKRAVAIYRIAFGQPRQDDLLAYLSGTIDPEELERLSEDLRVDLSPPPYGVRK